MILRHWKHCKSFFPEKLWQKEQVACYGRNTKGTCHPLDDDHFIDKEHHLNIIILNVRLSDTSISRKSIDLQTIKVPLFRNYTQSVKFGMKCFDKINKDEDKDTRSRNYT